MAAPSSATSKKPRSRVSKKEAEATTAGKAKASRASKAASAKAAATVGSPALRREIVGLGLLALALGILLALASFTPADLTTDGAPSNLIGPAGVWVGDVLLSIFGLGAFFFDLVLWYLGFCMLVGRRIDTKGSEIAGQLLFVFAGTVLSHLVMNGYLVLGHLPGGFIGEFCGEVLRGIVGTVGTFIVTTCMLLLGVMLTTDMSLGNLVRALVARLHRLVALVRHRLAVRREFNQRFEEERRRLLEAEHDELLDEAARAEAALSVAPLVPERYAFEESFDEEVDRKVASRLARLFGRRTGAAAIDTPRHAHAAPGGEAPATEPPARGRGRKGQDAPVASAEPVADVPITVAGAAVPATAPVAPADADGWELGAVLPTDPELDTRSLDARALDGASNTDTAIEVSDTDVLDMQAERKVAGGLSGVDADFGPQIVESAASRKARERKELLADDGPGPIFKPQRRGNFELPPINFLNYEKNDEVTVDSELLRSMAAQIEKTLGDFKVDGTIVEICPGPVITMFEFSPAPGVKISKIANLADDLAMALAALSVRIVAPIPGKGVVGIEVPNPEREMVYLKEIIADDAFIDNTKMVLPLALGKDTEGGPVIADLAKMPHLLVAGATGAGKSVAVNTMICSLLYKHSPDDVRMIMVDPKMLEFSIYADIPHLLLPVVTDPKQATVALNWAVQEMERRYQKLADMGVRDIRGYNQKVEVFTKQAEVDQLQGLEETEALKALGIDENGEPEHKKLPFIVVIIDEFADLMMTASKDVETAVARLAQKARAAGIHLILATQRPSTDVITGLIKANFPTRIALRVGSKIDSRVILDTNGAENLLGNGDMLLVPPGSSNLTRTHGAYVSEKEIDKIVEFLKAQGEPQYNESILVEEDAEEDSAIDDSERDEHYREAVRIVVSSQQASISMLQRKLRVGYNRAARMVELMEKEGIVGPSDSCKPRDVLVDTSPY